MEHTLGRIHRHRNVIGGPKQAQGHSFHPAGEEEAV